MRLLNTPSALSTQVIEALCLTELSQSVTLHCTCSCQLSVIPGEMERLSREVQREGLARVRILSILSTSYILFWSPLFAVTLLSWSWSWEYARNSTAHVVS